MAIYNHGKKINIPLMKGDVVYHDFKNEKEGRKLRGLHPCVVVSNSKLNIHGVGFIIVAPITSTRAFDGLSVPINKRRNDVHGTVLCFQIQPIDLRSEDISVSGKRIDSMTMKEIEKTIRNIV